MKHNMLRYSTIVLLIGLVALTAGQAYAQRAGQVEIESSSWGQTSGQIARVSVVNFVFADGSVRSSEPIIVRIQILDIEGEVVAQSDEIRIEPGKTRFWDVSRERIRAEGEPRTGRIQVRARMLVKGNPFDFNPNQLNFEPAVELIESDTGRTAFRNFNFRIVMSTTEI